MVLEKSEYSKTLEYSRKFRKPHASTGQYTSSENN